MASIMVIIMVIILVITMVIIMVIIMVIVTMIIMVIFIIIIFGTNSSNFCPHPLGQLGVHHEVVDVFFGPRELQLSRDHGNEERRTAGALKREGKRRLL